MKRLNRKNTSELTLGQMVVALTDFDVWSNWGWSLCVDTFREEVRRVVKFRNDFLHFRVTPIGEEDWAKNVKNLKAIAGVLQTLRAGQLTQSS